MVIQLLEIGIGQARPDVIRELISPRYRQHNPRVPDGPGGLLGFVERLSRAPLSQRTGVSVRRSIVDGDYVVTHAQYRRQGAIIAGFDMFRVEDGRLAEHWDAGIREPSSPPSGRTLIEGETENGDTTATTTNKALVRSFVETVMIARSTEGMESYFDGDRLAQHDPSLADGVATLRAMLDAGTDVVRRDEVLRVLGEGALVAVQSKGRDGQAVAVVYDMFRVEDGKIVEHWVSYEAVALHPRNDNGQF